MICWCDLPESLETSQTTQNDENKHLHDIVQDTYIAHVISQSLTHKHKK